MKWVELEGWHTDEAFSFNAEHAITIADNPGLKGAVRIIAVDKTFDVKGTRAEVVAKLEAEGLPPITPAFHKVLREACQDVRELLDHLGITEIPRSLGTNVTLFSEYTIETTEMYNRLRAKYPKKEEGERESPLPPSLGHSC